MATYFYPNNDMRGVYGPVSKVRGGQTSQPYSVPYYGDESYPDLAQEWKQEKSPLTYSDPDEQRIADNMYGYYKNVPDVPSASKGFLERAIKGGLSAASDVLDPLLMPTTLGAYVVAPKLINYYNKNLVPKGYQPAPEHPAYWEE